MAISAWLSPGVQTSTRSTSSRATSVRQSVSTDRQPSRSAAACGGLRVAAAQGGHVDGVAAGRRSARAVRHACEWAAPMNAYPIIPTPSLGLSVVMRLLSAVSSVAVRLRT